MDQKPNSGFGCGTFVLLGLAVVLAVIAGCGLLTFRAVKSGSRIAKEHFEEVRGRSEAVMLDENRMPDYAAYQKGSPLDRDRFLAWKADPRRTSIGEQAFREKAEGASVVWDLRVVDIAASGEGVLMKCEIPFEIKMSGNMTKSSSVMVTCDFAASSAESLLPLRKGDWVAIAGRASLGVEGDARILDAHLASGVAEKP